MGDEPPRRTLAARLKDRDRVRFTGRQAEVAFLDQCLDSEEPPAQVVHVCGPGGIGKSTLLREVARRAADRGLTVLTLDGRELGPAPGVLEDALRTVADDPRPVVLLDSYEHMGALDSYLRRQLLPNLPDDALVVIAGRGTPDAGWFTGGWESLTDTELKVAALVVEGLSNPEIAARLVLSRRTVTTHVSHILKKLDVATRTEIARESALRTRSAQ